MSAVVGSVIDPDWTAVAVGLPALIVSLLWVLDFAGMTTRVLRFFYRLGGDGFCGRPARKRATWTSRAGAVSSVSWLLRSSWL